MSRRAERTEIGGEEMRNGWGTFTGWIGLLKECLVGWHWPCGANIVVVEWGHFRL